MSDEDDDLFADSDSDDTAELISNSLKKKKSSPAPKKKDQTKKKKKASLAKKSKDDDDKGLFDSDSDEDAAPSMSRRERLEALAKRKKSSDPSSSASKSSKPKSAASVGEKTSGYESADSYDSATFVRTKEDDDFLDTTGEDAEAVQELYAEQHFDDEPPDGMEVKGKKKRKIRYDDDDRGERTPATGDKEPDNPIMAAVYRMKKKKRVKKGFTELEDEAKIFLAKMEQAAEKDEASIAERQPALHKLGMIGEVVDMLTKLDMQRMLLDLDLLVVCRRWIQPLPNGTLGNVTVRQKLLTAIGNITSITNSDLKRSDFGKTVMVLYKHRSETPTLKRQLKTMIEQWSRPIFQKSGNMRDLEHVQATRGVNSIGAFSSVADASRQRASLNAINNKKPLQDLNSLIASGKKGGGETGTNRVRVPFSQGFHFTARPADRTTMSSAVSAAPMRGASGANRNNLSKRMIEKGRTVGKNQRSANISIEGRPTK